MKYEVTIDGQTRDVEVELTPDGKASVQLDGKPVQADITRIPGGVSVRIQGSMFDVMLGGKPDAISAAAGPYRTEVSVVSERSKALKRRKGAGAGAGGKNVMSPMPGRVVKLLVQLGDEVTPGQPVVIIEAMKMENDLRAGEAGKVASIHCKIGDSVESGALLVTIE